MFYEPLWEYDGFRLVRRPDTANLYITWTPPGSRRYLRKSTGTGDLEDAKRELIRFAAKRRRPTANEPDEVSVLDCLVTYCERNIARREHPHAERTALKWWMDFLHREGIVTVADLTLDMQELFIERRRASLMSRHGSASNGTINRDLGIMRVALRDAWKRGHLSTVPHVAMLPTPPPRQRVLTTDEVKALLAGCHAPHLRLYIRLALHTLQRPGAIVELTCPQVCLARGVIDFNPPGRVLSNKRRAVVPITKAIRPELEDAIACSESGHLIEWKGKPVKSIKTAFAAAVRRAGLDGVCPYTLRHTGATLLAAAGVPMRQIAGMLGHTSTKTTEHHYAKHRPEYLSDAANALDTLFAEQKLLTPPDSIRQAA